MCMCVYMRVLLLPHQPLLSLLTFSLSPLPHPAPCPSQAHSLYLYSCLRRVDFSQVVTPFGRCPALRRTLEGGVEVDIAFSLPSTGRADCLTAGVFPLRSAQPGGCLFVNPLVIAPYTSAQFVPGVFVSQTVCCLWFSLSLSLCFYHFLCL